MKTSNKCSALKWGFLSSISVVEAEASPCPTPTNSNIVLKELALFHGMQRVALASPLNTGPVQTQLLNIGAAVCIVLSGLWVLQL